MAAIDVMPFDTSSYLADTGHLSLMQHGAYFLILLAMWRAGGWLADDERMLAKICKTTPDKWRHIRGDVRALLMARDGKLTQKRLLAEYEAEIRKRAKLKANLDSSFELNALKTNGATLPNEESAENTPSLLLPDIEDSQQGKKVRERPTRYSRGRRSQIAEDWAPSERGLLFAKSKNFDADKIAQMARSCLLYHRKHGTLISDLEAMWAHWVEKEIIFMNAARKNGTGRNGRVTMTDIAMGRAD